MKRQGRQHGMVRTSPILPDSSNPRPKSRNLNRLTSPPTAGLFTKVSPKPTNHSKFTSKCGRVKCHDCHSHPTCKSKDKAKGAHKIRSTSDVESDHRLITWRVVDATPGLKLYGFSASDVLNFLGNDDNIDCEYEDDYHGDDIEIEDGDCYGVHNDGLDENDEKVDDDGMSFYEVGFVWQPVDGDESWCLVEEM